MANWFGRGEWIPTPPVKREGPESGLPADEARESLEVAVHAGNRPLLNLHQLGFVVVRSRRYDSGVLKKRLLAILCAIREEAGRHSVMFTIHTACQVQRRLSPKERLAKQHIAANLAERFESLSWKLPAPRKQHQSETAAMPVVDGAAVGTARLTCGHRRIARDATHPRAGGGYAFSPKVCSVYS